MNRWHKTPHHKLSLVWFGLIILTVFPNLIFASTLVDPSRFLFTLKPGTRTTGTIKVTNPGNQVATVNAVVYDWTLNDLDKMVTSELGTRKDSLKGLIKFNPQNFKLAPGESQIVRFTLSAPIDNQPIERRGIVFFEEHFPHQFTNLGAQVQTQVGATIYLGVTGIKMAFDLGKIAVIRHGKTYRVETSIANPGVGHIRYRISYKIISEPGELINESQLTEQVILPGFRRKTQFSLAEKLEPGKYNLLLTIYFLGTNQTANRTIPFTVEK